MITQGARSAPRALPKATPLLFREKYFHINEKNKAIKNKIRRLSDTGLDLELLDQQARKILGLIGEDELIVFKIRY